MVERDIEDGQHRNPAARLLHDGLLSSAGRASDGNLGRGIDPRGVYGIEGPGWLLSDVTARLAEPRRRADLLRVARLLEAEPLMLGISAHLLVVARAPA
jgi:hypothetical protein